MQKLHVVGFTTDHEGLILSARKGSRAGGYVLAVDRAVEAVLDELREHRAESEAEDARAEATRQESSLSVREIQARLRNGRTVVEIAKAAGVDPEWVERFAPPVLAERARVIASVLAAPLHRARLGPSSKPIGDAIRHNLADRGVALTSEEFTEAWTARQVADGRWIVRFSFHYRARNHVLQFDVDEHAGGVTAADRESGAFGYVAPRVGSRAGGLPRDPSGIARASRTAKERERAALAMRKGVAQRTVAVERAAARRVRERAAEQARKERAERQAVAQAARVERDRARAAVAAERARKAAAKKAAVPVKKKPASVKKAAVPVRKKAAPVKRKAAAKKGAAPVKRKPAPVKRTAAAKKAAAPVKKKPAAARRKAPPARPRAATPPTVTPPPSVAAPKPTVTPPRTQPPVPRPPVPRPTVTAPPVVRPLFRTGFAERVVAPPGSSPTPAARPAARPAAPPGNGAVGAPPVRPRRTRPLRAT
ncbi:MAG: septation protein SepH [Microthrixaceae bacterium]